MAKKESKKRVYVLIATLTILLVLVLFAFIFGNKNEVITVTTAKVERRTITQTVSAIGKIEPETKVKISSETSGEIIYLGVREGDTVRKGQLIVRIKPDIIETQLEQFKSLAEAAKLQTEAQLAEKTRAENEFKRVTELYKKDFASKQEFETARANFERAVATYNASLANFSQALAQYKQMQKSFERTTISSPINGIVTKLEVEKGEKVVGTAQMAGTTIMEVADLSTMNAIVEVNENDIVNVKIGDTANIEIDAFPNEIFKGFVVETGHSAITTQSLTQDQTTNFKIKVRLFSPDKRLRPGMSCNVEIITMTKENILAVPLQSVTTRLDEEDVKSEVNTDGSYDKITEKNSKPFKSTPPSIVFVNENGKAKRITVKTGISDRGFIEIIQGLREGQEVISGSFIAVSKLLKDGSPIKIQNRAKEVRNKHKN
ncbi:MAG: efflux RND transporter periplasmic adaptor subunit [Candidatus Kapaibacteriales bacterium]